MIIPKNTPRKKSIIQIATADEIIATERLFYEMEYLSKHPN